MAKTVNGAFLDFLSNTVNLYDADTTKARSSRDFLIQCINAFSGDTDFFNVYTEKNLKFGSFARHTKIQPLDDIDLMICFSATNGEERRSYTTASDCIFIEGIPFDRQNNLLSQYTNHLNSTKVINRLINKLSALSNYSKAEMHKNHEAATLQLKSYTWNFDIVPCFYTDTGLYLIPDGSGNWKKTDPRIDNDRTSEINQKHKGKLLDVIRLMKYWNNRRITLRMGSYLLECMILSIYEKLPAKESYWVDLEFRDLLNALSSAICNGVPDPKGIQGDLNTFSSIERMQISLALKQAYYKAVDASKLELTDEDQAAAIAKWKEIFGPSFPSFSN